MQTIPEYICANLDTGQSIHFAPDTWFWVTSISGEDGLDVSISESQSAGQIGKTINGRAVGSRSVTVTGDIVGDYDASERLLKRLIQAGAPLRWTKILGAERYCTHITVVRLACFCFFLNLVEMKFHAEPIDNTARLLSRCALDASVLPNRV